MHKMVLVLILILILQTKGIIAETGLKSGFDKSGSFYNRLRYDGEALDFSLLASITTEGLDWIEPAFFTKEISAGRIMLKGIVRELNNPDSNTSLASVLTESGGMRVTDSISRSSRYGMIICPFDDYDLSLWFYRANNGLFSAGLRYNQPDIIKNSNLQMEADYILSGVFYGDSSENAWFSSTPVLPSQLGFNPGVELRLASGDSRGGRRMLIPAGDELSAAFSLIAAASVPQYTSCGALLRASAAAGIKKLYLCGLLQSVTPGYIAASGNPVNYSFIAGAGIVGAADWDMLNISGKVEYCLKRKKEPVLPVRFVEQKQIVKGSVELIAGKFNLKLKGDYESVVECSGIISGGAGMEASLKFETEIVSFNLGFEKDCDNAGNLINWEPASPEGGVAFKTESLKLDFLCGYKDQSLVFKTEADFIAEVYKLSGSIEISDLKVSGISLGFEL